SWSSKRRSSGTLWTWSDQLHTPMARGSIAKSPVGRGDARGSGARRWLDPTAERTQLHAVPVANLVKATDLLGLQLRHFLRPGPDDRPAAVVGFEHELHGVLDRAAEDFLQHLDHELHR